MFFLFCLFYIRFIFWNFSYLFIVTININIVNIDYESDFTEYMNKKLDLKVRELLLLFTFKQKAIYLCLYYIKLRFNKQNLF